MSIEKEEVKNGEKKTSRHVVIAYDYDKKLDALYCHFGYHNNGMLHITPRKPRLYELLFSVCTHF